MDDTTKKKAMQKVDHMGSKVGYEDELLDINKINDFYELFLQEMESDSVINNQVCLILLI